MSSILGFLILFFFQLHQILNILLLVSFLNLFLNLQHYYFPNWGRHLLYPWYGFSQIQFIHMLKLCYCIPQNISKPNYSRIFQLFVLITFYRFIPNSHTNRTHNRIWKVENFIIMWSPFLKFQDMHLLFLYILFNLRVELVLQLKHLIMEGFNYNIPLPFLNLNIICLTIIIFIHP